MSKRDSHITLLQIKEAAERAQVICSEKASCDELILDWKSLSALERQIEIIGEAVKRLPLEVRESRPEIPWKAIAGSRDRLSHGYDDVDPHILWSAVHKDIPKLIDTVNELLK